jgi:hypothetical protein
MIVVGPALYIKKHALGNLGITFLTVALTGHGSQNIFTQSIEVPKPVAIIFVTV